MMCLALVGVVGVRLTPHHDFTAVVSFIFIRVDITYFSTP